MSQVSRRTIVAAGVAGAGVIALASQGAPALAANGFYALQPGADPVRSFYLPAIGSTFQAVDGHRAVTLTLSAVEDLAPATRKNDEHRFNLLFTTGASAEAAIYTLRRPGTPTTTLYLSPIGQGSGPRTLQAIVNRNS